MRLGFWSGFALAECYRSFVQDMMGKEKYLAAVSALWVDTKPWHWVLVLSVVISLDVLTQALSNKKI